ncbi:unnamed protein product [Rhizoctonia solani]|uniref:Uncharacterized protein n=1 Tax=Rhizoctonia solani TaxID=456999 RepID=A0A8H3EB26_9AGAM|nr:unnamed protein product [Rhizoctonia solani]CAE7200037.1 unnamed protein product [Rhizoctonia solani]
MGLIEQFGTIVNALTVVDLSVRYGSQAAPVRQVVFPEDQSKRLMDSIAQSIKKSRDLLSQDNGLDEADVSSWRIQLSGYHLSLADEENVLKAKTDPRIEHFRRTEKLVTDYDPEKQRKRLELLSGSTERLYVEVLSKSKESRAKFGAAQQCPRFEDEDEEIAAQTSSPPLSTFRSWVQTKFHFQSNIEANGSIGTPSSGGPEPSTSPPQEPHELNVDAIETDNQMPEASGSTETPCRFSLTIELPGVNYVIRDPRIKTLDDAKLFCSPQSVSAISSVALGLARGKNTMSRGSYRFPYNLNSGTYDIPEEKMTDMDID